MITFLCIVAISVVVISILRIRAWQRMSRKSKAVTAAVEARDRIRKNTQSISKRKRRVVELAADVLRETKLFPFTEEYKAEVDKMIAAMDLKVDGQPMLADHLYLKQVLYCISAPALGILLVIAAAITGLPVMMGLIAVPTIPILYKLPLMQMRSDFKEEQILAMSQWIEFYNMYYSQFIQKELSVQMTDVVDNALPLANPALAKMLKRFKTDLDNSGPERALDALKHRYPDNIRIHKFVSVAKMRYNGDGSAFDMMRSVQDDLLADEDLAYKKDLIAKTRSAANVSNAIVFASLAMLFSVMVYAFTVT